MNIRIKLTPNKVYMSSAAETIKDRLGIVEVIGSYTKVEKAGANYKARCPFHNEKTPSFFISPGRNNYYCFGCGAKGDIFTFVQEFEKVDFMGSLKILAERAGVTLEQFRNENKGEHDRLRGVLELSTKFFESELQKQSKQTKQSGQSKESGQSKTGTSAIEYLKSRGLSEKMIADWRIGFAPNDWRQLHDHLVTKKVSQKDMELVGVIKRSDKEGARADSVYDRFRSRIMFPMFDPSSRVIGYSGRIFGVDESEGPKYMNSPDGVLFNKSDILYGYHKAKEGIRQWRYAILVEGQMDLLMCHQSGFTNTVATSGTSLTSLHLEKLKKISDNLLLVYDADKAGLKATLRAWTQALSLGMDVKVVGLPQGEDPASLLFKSKDAFKDALKNSKHIINYYLDMLMREFQQTTDTQKLANHTPEKFKKAVQIEVLPYVAAIESAIDRSNFISKISVQTNISESDIREEVEKLRASPSSVSTPIVVTQQAQASSGSVLPIKLSPNDIVIRRVAALILWLRSKDQHEKADDVFKNISEILLKEHVQHFEDVLKDHREELLFEAEVLFEGSSKLDKDIEELMWGVEERVLKERLSGIMSKLQIAEKKGDKQEAEKLLKDCQEISFKLSALNGKRNE